LIVVLSLASTRAVTIAAPVGLARPLAVCRQRRAESARLSEAPPALDDTEVFPVGPDGQTLVTYASLDKTGREVIEIALAQRNRERLLEGQPKYESVQAMVDAYVEFEGDKLGLSRAQCEDEVLRFLQRKGLLMEGGADFKDPQTIVTFGLLALIVVGAASNIASGNVVLGGQ